MDEGIVGFQSDASSTFGASYIDKNPDSISPGKVLHILLHQLLSHSEQMGQVSGFVLADTEGRLVKLDIWMRGFFVLA
jgi:hypothetical protein